MAFALPRWDDGLRAIEIGLERGQINEAVWIARGHVTDATDCDDDSIVGCTKQSCRCSSVGIFLNSSASESAPSLLSR